MLLLTLNLGGSSAGPPAPGVNTLPSLPSLTFPVQRTMKFATDLQRSVSGKTTRMALRRWPRVSWQQTYTLLRDDASVTLSELKLLLGFFNSLRGQLGSFLYTDPLFNTVNGAALGTGDGTTRAFQLLATYQANSSSPGTPEIIQNLNGIPVIKDNGSTVSTSAYTVSNDGIVTFNTAPLITHALTWSGSFYYQCTFDDDTQDFSEFMNNWWELKTLKFTSVVR